jgi:uncharacterized protein
MNYQMIFPLKTKTMNTLKKTFKYFGIVILFISVLSVSAQEFPEKPNPQRLVNDYANFLQPNEVNALENKLVQFNNETSTQIAIVIVKSLNGYDKASYSFQLAEKWGIGQKGKNNGILMLIKPKYRNEKGEVFIATGYGVEGAVPDAIAKRIVDKEIIPNFKNGNYYQGIDAAVNTMIELTIGEYTAEEYAGSGNVGSIIGPFLFFFLIIIFSIIGRIKRARHYSVGHNVPLWTALWLASSASRSSSSGWSSFSSGSGSFGGGGFGGFGGGGFGGGGAGGSW